MMWKKPTNSKKTVLTLFAFCYLAGTSPSLAQNSSKDLSTYGDCSPIIERVEGNVTVKCGPADIDVEFLLASISHECKDFTKQLGRWGQDILDWQRIRPAYYPKFNFGVIGDIQEHKSVIHQYDKNIFIGIYNDAIDIPELHADALDYRKSFGEYSVTQDDKKYLSAVDNLCFWAGHDIRLAEWVSKFDPDGMFIVMTAVKSLIKKYQDKKPITPKVEADVKGYWCSDSSDIYIGFHSFEDGFVNFEVGKREDGLFKLLTANPRLVRIGESNRIGILKDMAASAGLARGLNKPHYVWFEYEMNEDKLELQKQTKIDGMVETDVALNDNMHFTRCNRI